MEDSHASSQKPRDKNQSVLLPLYSNEKETMKEYILNVKALELCLALHEEQYERVLHYAEELREQQPKLSSKIRRRTATAEVTAYRVSQ